MDVGTPVGTEGPAGADGCPRSAGPVPSCIHSVQAPGPSPRQDRKLDIRHRSRDPRPVQGSAAGAQGQERGGGRSASLEPPSPMPAKGTCLSLCLTQLLGSPEFFWGVRPQVNKAPKSNW